MSAVGRTMDFPLGMDYPSCPSCGPCFSSIHLPARLCEAKTCWDFGCFHLYHVHASNHADLLHKSIRNRTILECSADSRGVWLCALGTLGRYVATSADRQRYCLARCISCYSISSISTSILDVCKCTILISVARHVRMVHHYHLFSRCMRSVTMKG